MKKYILLIVFLTIIGCKTNECEDIACFTPPQPFIFELVDGVSGDNLFSIGQLDSNEIKIINEVLDPVSFTFISENEYNLIDLSEIGWNMSLAYYTVKIEDIEFTITLEMEEKHENCCNFFNVKQFDISNYEFEQSNTTGIYTIKID